ncbi:phenylalanine--tRNA ligase subunit beta [Flavobacterium johnsoniae]|uniref:Phenylalanine--tRNA ligase beta subunit n=1 Tax=Flavobacterium johnsoniae (strain ATCC 17061 / DSM 2064 / JCM 8514 / BCRC 14874 / CCUG 350202 / NBRC 14942 / NCIMB 11054 / UW101) TaxID=376686 RepID=A5FFM8_FLAJ1|nr:phenylalanine--tRNA ligase subunit beta [Flavobacterium johnsoniae]ABQ05989.1 phenylalanyl-tRNA synthetase, beta subunit [Flavobacterium johnsoniae UW101]OXG00642.1 phenylalanine--tRNA ligase subunit beta [Flavobacterium johnsoniae UW101]WQG81726.1 phenylalanine--tRNA ligase subunit beta [Flavobacterium johnsoniae UW101]SHK62352.1 phenylalanyl-tRNA synthetase beta subunit [Flavobacterium johnsoniae]
MKISYNWLKQFIKTDWTSEQTSELLTDLGLEVEVVEKYQSIKGGLEGVVVGHVLTCEKHPDADRLKVTTVNIGLEAPVQIVCGAANVAAGQKVPVATIGTVLYDKEGTEFTIKKGKIRGQDSHGMICAEDELGLGTSHDGIMVLDENLVPGTPASEVFQIANDEVFEIGLTPNRADAMSHFGTARDLRAGMLQRGVNIELITPSVSNFRVDMRTLKIDVNVEEPALAPRYCGVTISGITVQESPNWLQDRLKAIGLTPKNNIVDVTNYVLHELGQPLHAFDAAKINGKVIVKTLPAGTKFTTLDDVERTLHAEDLMICDEKGPLCIAGVFGGKKSGVSEGTTAIFLESAYFDAVSVRKTAKRHQLNTDASFRFERGIDPTITEYALKRAALLIQEVAGGKITSDVVEVYPKKVEDFSVLLNFSHVSKIIGQEIPKDTIKKILVSLDIKVNSVSDTGLGLTIPAYRVDVQREIDVIEEILRVYGYNNIEFSKKFNATVANSPRTEDYKVQNVIASQLNSQGFHEMMANSLTTAAYAKLSTALKEEHNVTMLNPLSSDLSTMRQSLLFSALEAVSYNINRRNSDLKLFEFGKSYHKYLNGYEEHKHLTLSISGNRNKESWTTPQKGTDFFLLKGYVKAVLARLGIEKISNAPVQSDIFSEGTSICYNNDTLVEMGVVKKSILKHFGIKQDVYYADFNWDLVLKIITGKIKYTEIPKYPEVRRDLALLIDEKTTYESIFNLARQTEKTLLKDINLFDVYQGNKLPEGKKSYALSFTIQDNTKTLTDAQIDKIMSKLQQTFETELGASLR